MHCEECQTELAATHRHDRRFCGKKCRDTYNNRRKARGEKLYDLFMAMRFDRKAASLLGVWAIMCRMASEWNEEDKAAGIKSFSPASEVLMRHPKFSAKKFNISRKRP